MSEIEALHARRERLSPREARRYRQLLGKAEGEFRALWESLEPGAPHEVVAWIAGQPVTRAELDARFRVRHVVTLRSETWERRLMNGRCKQTVGDILDAIRESDLWSGVRPRPWWQTAFWRDAAA